MNTIDRYRGSLLGLAAGDALGTTLEFHPPGSFQPVSDMVGGGPFRLKPGQWTDDTSMALCLAESLIDRRGFDPVDQLKRYCDWFRNGHLSSTGDCFDIGNTTRAALIRFESTGEDFCGSTSPSRAGNGSIMRLAPVPLFFAGDPQIAIEKSGESSCTTHGAVECIDACRYLGALIAGAVNGVSKSDLLCSNYSPVPDYWNQHPLAPAVAATAEGSFQYLEPPEIKGTGYVVQSLEATAIINLAPDRADGWIHRSFALHDLQRTQEAFDQLLPVADKFPKIWTIPYNLACYASRLHQFDVAQKWLKQAITVDTKTVQAAAIEDEDLKPLWASLGGTMWKRE